MIPNVSFCETHLSVKSIFADAAFEREAPGGLGDDAGRDRGRHEEQQIREAFFGGKTQVFPLFNRRRLVSCLMWDDRAL